MSQSSRSMFKNIIVDIILRRRRGRSTSTASTAIVVRDDHACCSSSYSNKMTKKSSSSAVPSRTTAATRRLLSPPRFVLLVPLSVVRLSFLICCCCVSIILLHWYSYEVILLASNVHHHRQQQQQQQQQQNDFPAANGVAFSRTTSTHLGDVLSCSASSTTTTKSTPSSPRDEHGAFSWKWWASSLRSIRESLPTRRVRGAGDTQRLVANTTTTTNDTSLFFLNESFVYANETYHYRYSDRLLTRSKEEYQPTRRVLLLQDNQNRSILPSVIFGVCANGAKPIRRQAIRKSWGREAPVYFLVAGDWDSVSAEFFEFGDILWVDTPEGYRNALTPKTFAFIHFSTSKAIPAISAQALSDGRPPVEYMFKTDDDAYVNTTEISRELHAYNRPDYYGLLRKGRRPVRKTDDPRTRKWYMTPEEYQRDIFPTYVSGIGYALSKKFGDCASREMATIVPMPWEDVATGLLAEACHTEPTSANNEWRHFIKTRELEKFPYARYKNGNELVKILHKVRPEFQEPLSRQASLSEINITAADDDVVLN